MTLDLPILLMQAGMIIGSLFVGWTLAQIGQRERLKKEGDRRWYDGFIYAAEQLEPKRDKGGRYVSPKVRKGVRS